MRLLATIALALGCAATTAALSAAVMPSPKVEKSPGDKVFDESWNNLRAAVFTTTSAAVEDLSAGPPRLDPVGGPAAEAGIEAGFRQPAFTGTPLDAGNALATETYVPGQGLARWKVTEMAIARPAARAVDAVRISVGQIARTPGALPPSPGQAVSMDTAAYQVSYTRGWPQLLTVEAGQFDLDFTPHAGAACDAWGRDRTHRSRTDPARSRRGAAAAAPAVAG